MKDCYYHSSEALFTSVESYFHRIDSRMRWIYILLLFFVTFSIVSIYFIRIPVLINSRGLIRPINDNSAISSMRAGQIDRIFFTDGQHINKNDIILRLDKDSYQKELDFYRENLSSLKNEYIDLRSVCSGQNDQLRTEKYRSALRYFNASLEKYHTQLTNLRKELSGLSILLADSLIAKIDYIDHALKINQTLADSAIFHQKQLNLWQTEKEKARLNLFDLESKIELLNEKIRQSGITAPISGTIQGLKGLETGSLVFLNQELCKIIPDTTLIAQVFVGPGDIAWIQEGLEAKLLIDSYNHQYWGSVKGYCYKIPKDLSVINDKAVFVVECRLPDPRLFYAGREAKITAGQSFTAQFIVSENTIWELIKGKLQQIILP